MQLLRQFLLGRSAVFRYHENIGVRFSEDVLNLCRIRTKLRLDAENVGSTVIKAVVRRP